MVVDLSTSLAPPMKFLLQQGYKPAGIRRQLDNGCTESRFPWYLEWTVRTSDPQVVGIVYFVPHDENSGMLVACLGEAPTVLVDLMNGADYGEGVTQLVDRHWPHITKMLRESRNARPSSRFMCQIHTPSKVQWAVADPLPSLDDVPGPQVADLVTTSLNAYIDFVDFPNRLPGLIEVLGGPDRTTRRLKAVAGLFNTAGDLSYLSEGISLGEFMDLAKTVIDAVTHLRALKD